MAISIGRKIQGLRKAKGLSQDEFAGPLGVNRSTVDRWEDPDADPSASRLKQIAVRLQVRVGYFFDEIPSLIGLSFRQVAARESLRLVLLEWELSEVKHPQHRLWKTIDAADAPVTADGWKVRASFVELLSGKKKR